MENQNRKTKKIFRKIFWPIVHILLIFAIATFAFNYFSIDRFVKENAKEKIEEAYDDIQEQLNDFTQSKDKEFSLKPSENLVNQSNNTKVYVFDKDFNSVALFDNSIYIDKGMTNFLADLLMNYELDENVLTTIRFNDREYLANTYTASPSLNIIEKYFVVVQDLTDKRILLRESSKNMLIIEGLILLLVLFTVFVIARDLSKPLIKLSKESEEYVIGKGTTIDDNVISTKELESLRIALKNMQIKIDEEVNKKNTIYENVAHDLRTPLVSILGYADGLKSGIIKDKNKACDVILRTGNQLKEMIENILVLSRFDNDTYKGNKEELSLVDLISEQVETVKVIDEDIKVEFVNELEDEGMITSDRKLLIRIIQNLLSNAIKYANSKVTIRARIARPYEVLQCGSSHTGELHESIRTGELREPIRTGELREPIRTGELCEPIRTGELREPIRTGELREPHYTISVTDDGDGIDSSNIENIFTRYYKGEDGHFGIGLAVVKSSVDHLGGKITVESERGKGTTFTCFLMNMF